MLSRSKMFLLLLMAPCAPLVAMSCVLKAPRAESTEGQNVAVPIVNAGFETVGADNRPSDWQADDAARAPGVEVRIDSAVSHSGRASLHLSAATGVSTVLSSQPVELKVGHVYRLRGWIKAQGAYSDPGSRYPTAVPACLSMASFPFTNHSPAVGADSDWRGVETHFVATRSRDRVRVHFGKNGKAWGKVWFDDIGLEEIADIGPYIPPPTVRWAGEAYRYDDRGWIFVHVEGKPYERGYQFGYLVSGELATYLAKVAQQEISKDPAAGWNNLRQMADALMLRKYDDEYLMEMKGIADGAAKGGAKYEGRDVDLVDVVALNSLIDLGQIKSAMRVTPHALSGQSFLSAEEEMGIPDDKHKCSAFAATGPVTADGRVVFGQIFMWSGYTGVHFNILLDVVPARGRRLIYQTFPGGIHSGTDFYVNSAGIVLAETTVVQTPFEPAGTPQSNRARKAAQYATSIDEVARILRENSNGLYTNDWPMADVKKDQVAVYLLGTRKDKMWRDSPRHAPFGTPGFLWSVNNNRDPEVRREYAAHPEDAPYDLIFSPWNRDVAFRKYYDDRKGKMDAVAGAELLATSPINRPHACDGKITTSEMAEKLVFLAHYGKVTLREKFPQKDARRMPDLPGAIPHLTLGYSTASPVIITEQLKQARRRAKAEATPPTPPKEPTTDAEAVAERFCIDKKKLWHGTLIPRSAADNWLVSGTSAYWNILHALPEDSEKAQRYVQDQLGEINSRLLYVVSREGDLVASQPQVVYDRYGHYQIPRIKGTFVLHQLRLLLGNERFLTVMQAVHHRYANTRTATQDVIALASKVAQRDLEPFVRQWIDRTGLPDPRPAVTVEQVPDGWKLRLEVAQPEPTYHLLSSIAVDAGDKRMIRPVEIHGPATSIEFVFPAKPTRVVFHAGRDFPVQLDRFYTWANFADDFQKTLIVYGTSRQIEAHHTLALRWQSTLADAYSEILPSVVKDCEITDQELASHDLIVLGQPEDNSLLERMRDKLPVEFGKNYFRWQGKTYAATDDGLFVVLPNPYNIQRVLYLIAANSALEIYQMTKSYSASIPAWAIFKGDEIKEQGYHPVGRFVLEHLEP